MQRLIALLFMTLLATNAAHSHAMLDHANPPVGSTVSAAPREVSLTFTQNLQGASSIEVTDAAGARVDTGKAQVSGSTMRVGLKALRPGSYHVRWHALSVDSHKTEGSFTFHIGTQ